ncbi:hypothetical protein LJK87_22745 [Paenibacillus sp. P25]|nr:hypothetical protein LJK87_22745 [Paenibacillus sp. P25]
MNEQTHTIRNSDEKLFDAVVNLLAALILLAVLYPLLFIVSASFSDPALVLNGEVLLLAEAYYFRGI